MGANVDQTSLSSAHVVLYKRFYQTRKLPVGLSICLLFITEPPQEERKVPTLNTAFGFNAFFYGF